MKIFGGDWKKLGSPLLTTFVVGLLLSGCSSEDPADKARQSLFSQKADLASLEMELAAFEEKVERLRADASGATALRSERQELLNQIRSLEKVLQDDAILLQAYKDAFQEASLPVGSELGNLTLTDGRVLERTFISSVSLPTVALRHANGVGSFPVASLPQEIQEKFRVKPTDLSNSEVDARNILASKPTFLLTPDELQRQREQKEQAQELARKSENDKRMRESHRAESMRRQESAEREQRSQEAHAKRAKIDAKIEQLSRRRNDLKTAMNNVPRGSFNRPRSSVDVSKDQNKYLQQIATVEAAIAKLQAEKNAIPW